MKKNLENFNVPRHFTFMSILLRVMRHAQSILSLPSRSRNEVYRDHLKNKNIPGILQKSGGNHGNLQRLKSGNPD